MARRVNHAMTASRNDNNGDDGGLPKFLVERKLQNGGVLWELLRTPLAAECQQRQVLVDRNGSIKWCTVRLTSIDHPQIEGKFTATPGGLTYLFYGCKD